MNDRLPFCNQLMLDEVRAGTKVGVSKGMKGGWERSKESKLTTLPCFVALGYGTCSLLFGARAGSLLGE